MQSGNIFLVSKYIFRIFRSRLYLLQEGWAYCRHSSSNSRTPFCYSAYIRWYRYMGYLFHIEICCTAVSSYHFEVQHSLSADGQSDRIQYTHVMSRGRTKEKHYGQSVCRMCAWCIDFYCCYATAFVRVILGTAPYHTTCCVLSHVQR